MIFTGTMIFNAKTQRAKMRPKFRFYFANFAPVLRVFALKTIIYFLISSTVALAATWQTEIQPGPRDNFTKAAFSLWLDESVPAPIALLVIAPGWNGDGRNAINDAKWQSYARENRLGLVGLCIQSNHDDQKLPYHIVEHGSGHAVLEGITRLAAAANRPALSKAPLLIWGHSAGGQLGYGMACFAPQRVIAFAAIKGGFYLSKPTTGTFNVPGLFIIGERDEPFRAINITAAFEAGRAKGAPWCLAFEPNSGHEVGRANDLVLPFFSGVLALQKNGGLKPGHLLPPSSGWMGIRATLEVSPGSTPKNSSLTRTVWLPNQGSAAIWQSFQNTSAP